MPARLLSSRQRVIQYIRLGDAEPTGVVRVICVHTSCSYVCPPQDLHPFRYTIDTYCNSSIPGTHETHTLLRSPPRILRKYFFFLNHHFHFEVLPSTAFFFCCLDKPWSQVSSPLPPPVRALIFVVHRVQHSSWVHHFVDRFRFALRAHGVRRYLRSANYISAPCGWEQGAEWDNTRVGSGPDGIRRDK